MPNYKTIDTASAFIGWGKLDQEVEIEVLTFDPTGGTTAQGKPCPRVVGTLVADADNYKNLSDPDNREHVRLRKGEQVTVEGGIENLRKALLIADPKRGDLLKMTYVDTYVTDKGNKGKVIKVQHAPASEGSVSEDDI